MSEPEGNDEVVHHPDGSATFPAMARRLAAYLNDPANDSPEGERVTVVGGLGIRNVATAPDGTITGGELLYVSIEPNGMGEIASVSAGEGRRS